MFAVDQGSMKRNTQVVVSPGAYRLCAAAVMYALGQPVLAQDAVTPFQLTGIEGHAELRYNENRQIDSDSGSSSTQTSKISEETIYLMTHSYIYHPNFLKMDLGIGPVFDQSSLQDSSAGTVSDNSIEYDLNVRLSFLDGKPYPLTLYYDRDHPTVALSMIDVFRQNNEVYGAEFQLMEPVLPFNLSMGASHHQTQGQGFSLRVDDQIDVATVRAQMLLGHDGYSQFIYNTVNAISGSGYVSQPAVTTTTQTDSYTFDSRTYFGNRNQYQLTNYLIHTDQAGDRPLDEWRYTPELRVNHSADLDSYYRFIYASSDQVSVSSDDIGGSGGFSYKPSDNININGEVHTDKANSNGLNVSTYGATGSVIYKRDYSFGTLNLNAGISADYYDRVASQSVSVVDLLLKLIGTIPQFLPNDNIDLNSIQVFRVFAGGSQSQLTVGVNTSCDGTFDILVTSINAKTTIENCNGATDGDIQVSVSYSYDPGGTVAYTNFIQSYQASLALYQNYNLYVRYRDSSALIKSGVPTQPLPEGQNSQVGAQVDYPVYSSLRIGGELKYEKEDGSLNTYNRDSAELHFQFGLFNGLLYASTRYVNVDYANTTQDLYLIQNVVRFRARPWNRVGLTFEINNEKQTSGNTEQVTRVELFNAEWRLRKLKMLAEVRHMSTTYGTSETEILYINLSVRRDF